MRRPFSGGNFSSNDRQLLNAIHLRYSDEYDRIDIVDRSA